MHRRGFGLAFCMAVILGSSPVVADQFAGFYQGIDAGDGSIDTMSIVPNGDGTYTLRVIASRMSFCLIDDTHRSGVLTATARVINGRLSRQDVEVRCEGSDEVLFIPDSTYEYDARNGILTLVAVDDGRLLHYHRISK